MANGVTYHDGKGRFSSQFGAHTVTREGVRYKVVRQLRTIKGKKEKAVEPEDVIETMERARAKASLAMVLSASPGWVPVHELATGRLAEGERLRREVPVPEEVMKLIDKISKDVDEAVRQLSAHGKGQTLKTGKPKDGIYAYVWRMARFHSGADPKMPVTCDWDLSNGIEERTGINISFCLTDKTRKEVLDKLDDLAEKALVKMNISPMGAAKIWGRAMGYF